MLQFLFGAVRVNVRFSSLFEAMNAKIKMRQNVSFMKSQNFRTANIKCLKHTLCFCSYAYHLVKKGMRD